MQAKKDSEIIFGLRAVIEAIDSGKSIDKIWVSPKKNSPLYSEVFAKGKDAGVTIVRVPFDKLNSVTRKNHQGCVAFISPVPFYEFEEILAQTFESGAQPFFLFLDRISDVRNFGAICRTAESAGVHAIVVPQKGAALISGDAIKTSAGAIMHLHICKVNSLWRSLETAKQSGLQLIGFNEKAEKRYYDLDYTQPIALVMGSEEKGLSSEVAEQLNEEVSIPLTGKTASLNVSVAAGIGIFEVVKQRTINT